MKRRMMTDAERAEIAEIERQAKERSDAAAKKLFGSAAGARHPRLS